jgi:small subunit ribosomal protein S8e
LSNHAQRKLDERKKGTFEGIHFVSAVLNLSYTEAKIDPLLESQFGAGRLYAAISSRHGQSGRADGYILEGKELEVRALSL